MLLATYVFRNGFLPFWFFSIFSTHFYFEKKKQERRYSKWKSLRLFFCLGENFKTKSHLEFSINILTLLYSHLVTQWAKMRKKFQFQKCVWLVARLSQRQKSTFFEKKFLWDPPLEIFSKNIDLAFEANSALSCKNGLFPRFSSFCFAH